MPSIRHKNLLAAADKATERAATPREPTPEPDYRKAYKAPSSDPIQGFNDLIVARYLWYWSLTPEQRKAQGLPELPESPLELTTPKRRRK